MRHFWVLDLSDMAAVMDWLGNIREAWDDRKVRVPARVIVRALKAAGYQTGYKCELPDSWDDYGRWFIGEAVGALSHHPFKVFPYLTKTKYSL